MTYERFTFGHKPIFKSPPEPIVKRPLVEMREIASSDQAVENDRVEATGPADTAADLAPAIEATEEHVPTEPKVEANTAPDLPWLEDAEPTPSSARPAHRLKNWSLAKRVAALVAIIAIPAMAAANDFDGLSQFGAGLGALPGDAPTEAEMVNARLQEELKRNPAMPFEKPGMSFPGSAFFFLAEPPADALIALPDLDALAEGVGEAGREVGEIIDAGPGATPFFGAGGLDQMRAESCLAQAVWYEAASESEAGQRAVAQVVLNRVAHPSWPNSVCGVVYEGSSRSTGCQFTFTCDGSLSRNAGGRTWQRAQEIAGEALAGSVYEPIGHATHYHTLWVNPYWASSLDHVGTIGAHRFYRNRGAGGRKDAFTQSYAGAEPGARERVTALPSVELPTAGADIGPASSSGYLPSLPGASQVGPSGSQSGGQGGGLQTQVPATAVAGPGAIRTNEAVAGVGQVRQDYSQAGQWKSDAARAALLEAQEQSARDAAAQSSQRSNRGPNREPSSQNRPSR